MTTTIATEHGTTHAPPQYTTGVSPYCLTSDYSNVTSLVAAVVLEPSEAEERNLDVDAEIAAGEGVLFESGADLRAYLAGDHADD